MSQGPVNPYTTGERVRMIATCSDVNGNLVDPSSIVCEIKLPDGTVDSSESVTRQSAGIYTCDYTTVQTGPHYYRFVGTGAAVVAGEGEFITYSNFVS